MMCAWPIKPLGEICDFSRGLTYAKSDEAEFSANVVLRANNVDLRTGLLDLSDLRYIDDKVMVPATKRLRKGALLICTASGSKSHVGKIAYIDADYGYAFGGFMGQIVAREGVDPRYLYYAMRSPAYTQHLSSMTDGANINNLKFSELATFDVPIPPLAEQRRVVAILDEAFEGIDVATANAEKNLANARELFQSELNQIFCKPAGSAYRLLGQIAKFNGGSQPPKSTFVDAPKERYVRLIQIRDFKTDKYACYVPVSDKNRLCFEDDILIGRYGASVGQIHRGKAGAYNVALIKAVPIETEIDREYFYYYLRSGLFQSALTNVADRSAQNGFGKEDISSFEVPLPDLETQREKVKVLERAGQQAAGLGDIYVTKLTLLAELKQSILHRAFNGDLSPAEALAA